MMFGIDISHWQGAFDFATAKAEGVEFAIIKAGGGDNVLYRDSRFEANYANAKKFGLPVGAYFFAHCFSVDEAIKEADYFLSIIKGKIFEMPVYMDVEAAMLSIPKRALTDIIIAFLDRLEAAGYYAGIYSSTSNFGYNVYDSELKKYTHWVAQYYHKCTYTGKPDIWQFGGEANFLRSNKIAGKVCDQNFCYVDFPTVMREYGLNGFPKKQASIFDNENDIQKEVVTMPEKRYNTVAEIVKDFPWAGDDIRFLCDNGVLLGNSGERDENGYPIDLDLTEDMVRVMIFQLRVTRKLVVAIKA